MWLVREREREEEIQRQNREMGIEEKTEEQYEFEISLWDRIIHHKLLRGIIVVIAIAIILPIFLFLFLDMREKEFDKDHTCSINTGYRVPCGLNVTVRKKCSTINCCFDDKQLLCFHFFPSKYIYNAENWNNNGYFTARAEKTPFGRPNKKKVYLTLNEISRTSLSILLQENPIKRTNITGVKDAEYNVTVFTEQMAVLVRRTNNDILLTTSRGPTIISDRYWEWTVDLNATYLFGMDLLLVPENKTVTRIIYKNADDHTSIAKFMAYSNGKFHGLQIEHSGPLEVTILPAKLIILKLLSGHELKLTLTTGPTPIDVLQQQRGQQDVKMPAYWNLGVHICRDGKYSSIEKVISEFDDLLSIQNKPVPYDSDCIHENIFSLATIVTQKEMEKLKDAVGRLKSKKKYFMISLAPQISTKHTLYQQAEKLKILYTNKAQTSIGSYLSNSVAYPDYSLKEAKNLFNDWYKSLSIDADGLVLRSTWPANDKYEMTTTTEFQYLPQKVRTAVSRTLPWNSQTPDGQEHILTHNHYGHDFTRAVDETIKKDFILSSTYNTDSSYAVHVQNVNISWVNFKNMLTKTLSHSLFGGTLYSIPVCGSTSFYEEKLNHAVCMRWYLTAATLPVFRVSSELPRRDPHAFTSNYLQDMALEAIQIRYTLLPYYYTILSEDMPLVRPMFVDFYEDNRTLSLDEQYMVGKALLVAQPMLFPISNLKVYLPKIPGGWFEFWGGQKIHQIGWLDVPIVETDLVIFIAAGHIIPMQNSVSASAEESRLQPLRVAIALDCSGKKCKAAGKLHVSDSFSLEFIADENSLQVSNILKDKLCNKLMASTLSAQIATMQVYGLMNYEDEGLLFSPNVNLCETTTSKYTIPFK